MRHLDEYRDPSATRALIEQITARATRSWSLMEVCGGQTHSILRFGVDELLPPQIQLIHGPGCPVCVTPLEQIDAALEIAATANVIFCSFGDMLRVPGSDSDLLTVKARGGDVRIVYSPLDALEIARQNPDASVVFFAVGFETTAPANAMAVYRAAREGIENFSLVMAHVLVPPSLDALLADPDSRIDALLAPGHVCTVTGWREYQRIADQYAVPVVVTGFEPIDLLAGVLAAVTQLEQGRAEAVNEYRRVVSLAGNPQAQRVVDDVFVVADRKWRGLGEIPGSGYELSPRYARFDARKRFGLALRSVSEPAECRSGLILQGKMRPTECPQFGNRCTPESPLGATMVSSEGACAAYFAYGRTALTVDGRPVNGGGA